VHICLVRLIWQQWLRSEYSKAKLLSQQRLCKTWRIGWSGLNFEWIRVALLRRRLHPAVTSLLIFLFILLCNVVTVAVSGVIGNRADAHRWDLPGILGTDRFVPIWALLFMSSGLTLALIMGWILYFDKMARMQRQELALVLALRQLATMANMVDNQNGEIAIEAILSTFLQTATTAFAPHVCRASIMRPDKQRRCLEVWAHHGMDAGSLPNDKFNIRDNFNGKRGVAGHTFMTGELGIVHLRKEGALWKGDHDHYLPSSTDVATPAYRAVATTAILGVNRRPIGILCFDSIKTNTFDHSEDHILLDDMAAIIGSLILTYKAIMRAKAVSANSGKPPKPPGNSGRSRQRGNQPTSPESRSNPAKPRETGTNKNNS
jgi:hypothetical protein